MGRLISLLVIILFSLSCVPRVLITEHPKLVSYYFTKKIESLEKKKDLTFDQQRALLKTKVEYGFGILMEESDRVIDDNYNLGVQISRNAYIEFNEAKKIGNSILSNTYPRFDSWLKNGTEIIFKSNDVFDLYWLAAAFGGAIRSSRGNPFEVVNLPVVKKLLETAINLNSNWGRGALYSAMMNYTSSRPDLFGDSMVDSISYFYEKALIASDSLNASVYVSYAEIIDKKYQNKTEFEQKLHYVIQMDDKNDKDFRLSNIIAQERAKWLLTKTDEYFFE
jgi:hypothetical protein